MSPGTLHAYSVRLLCPQRHPRKAKDIAKLSICGTAPTDSEDMLHYDAGACFYACTPFMKDVKGLQHTFTHLLAVYIHFDKIVQPMSSIYRLLKGMQLTISIICRCHQ